MRVIAYWLMVWGLIWAVFMDGLDAWAMDCEVVCESERRTRVMACDDDGSALHQAWRQEERHHKQSCTVQFTQTSTLYARTEASSCDAVERWVSDELGEVAGRLPEISAARVVADEQARRLADPERRDDPAAWDLVQLRASDVLDEAVVWRQEIEMIRTGARALANTQGCTDHGQSLAGLLSPVERVDVELLLLAEEARSLRDQASHRLTTVAAIAPDLAATGASLR